ncbi:hypothetical protein Pint_30439 [Pistacia integerrima]|uniref:Uncharacterized protein n=1 Tax=Pistacia integerrima TaxID=434235 RepID=A0ACC0X110_9ROSI|nr:hypothetical protein Pint_30439 [Pistacia integerrima]
MGACASKPKEIDNAPCEAPTTPKSNQKNNNINRAPLVDHSKPKNKTVEAVEKKVETTEPELKTEKKFEVAVVDDAKPAFARPAKAETENKFIKEENADQNVKGIGKKVEGKVENVKESEKKIELTNDQKAAIDAEPAFARQAVEKKVETTEKTEKKFEVAVVDDAEPAFAKPSKAQTENKFIEEANADQNVKKIGNKVKGNVDNVKENDQKVAIDAEPAFAGQEVGEKVQKKDKGVGEKAKEIEKVEGLAEKAKESAKTVDKKVEAKATAKEIEKKVEAASIPSKAKEIEKVESLAEKAKASAKTVEKKVEAKATAKEIENKVEAAAIPSKAKEIEKVEGLAEKAKASAKTVAKKVEAKATAKETIAKEMEKVEAPIVGKFDKIDEAPQKSEKLDQK